MVCYMSSDISNMGLVMGMLNGLAHILFLHDHISCQAISCRGVCGTCTSCVRLMEYVLILCLV